METDRLTNLSTKLESGEITDRELGELESLLENDYEARERFLDHAQIEGMLRGAAGEVEGDKVVPLPKTVATEGPKRHFSMWAAVAAVVVLLGVAALWPTAEKNDHEPVPIAEIPKREPKAELSPDERYEMFAQVDLGGSSLAHPETADAVHVKSPGERIQFNRDVRPILSDKCFFCHGPDAEERKAGLRLDTREGALADLGGYFAITPGNHEESELILRVFDSDPDSVMPPPESSRTLTEAEKETLKTWIEQGAEWQNHWAFEPPRRAAHVPQKTAAEHFGAIDYLIGRKLKEQGLDFSPEAEKETLIRRVTLDLTGVPPTIAEVDAFLADKSPEAYERVVDRLFKSPRYAERMTWQWLEAARYADTDGYQNDGPRDMWRWRDWVISAYGENMPFDQFTIEQLAGDLLPNPTEAQLIATGFNRNHRYNSESGLVLEEFLLENAVDRVDTTATVWMGATVGCARCHDHKYDPFSQKEYYQLISFFDGVTESGRAIKVGNSEPWIKAPTDEQKVKLAELDQRLGSAKSKLKALEPNITALLSEAEAPDWGKPIISEGLTHHFGQAEPIFATGEKPVQVSKEKIPGLVTNSRFSVAFTMTPETVENGAVLSNETGSTTRNGIFVKFAKGHLRFSIVGRWVAGVATLETLQKFLPGEQAHITLTNDGTQRADGMKIYVNGKPAKTLTIRNTNSNAGGKSSGGPMHIGGSKHLKSWKGEVSDLRFYTTRTLEPLEAKLLGGGAHRRRYFLEHDGPKQIRTAFAVVEKLKLERQKYIDSLPTTMVMREGEKSEPTRLRIRGEYHNKGEAVSPGVPEVFPAMESSFSNDRLGFAQWLVNGEHPLTARVAVNRYWQMLFGAGLVRTSEDFGTQGSLPTHPELLDWLAMDFWHNGWDVRGILKTIVMSRTYCQSSRITPELLAADPLNLWLARAPRLKLAGNQLRDQALFASGLLVEKAGGPSVKPYQPANLWREASNVAYKQGRGEDLHRRSLYTYWKRTLAPPSMAVLDTADREWCSVKPKSTNTPLQALTLLNETAFFEAARKLGERVLLEAEADLESRVEFAFRSVLSRKPSEREVEILAAGYENYRTEAAKDPSHAAKVTTVGESKVAKGLDPVELAAATAMANVILNLEEASVKE